MGTNYTKKDDRTDRVNLGHLHFKDYYLFNLAGIFGWFYVEAPSCSDIL